MLRSKESGRIFKGEHSQIKRRYGSSSLFQKFEQSVDEDKNDLKSFGMYSVTTSEIQEPRQQRFKKRKSIDQKYDHHQDKSVKAEQQSFDEMESQQDKDNEIRWQDDGRGSE
jgi:hypothetical protein